MLLPTSSEYLVKIAHGIRPCGAFISEILVKFSVWGTQTPPPHQFGWNLAWKSRRSTPPRHISPRPVQRVDPAWRKISKSPRISEIPAICAASNVALLITFPDPFISIGSLCCGVCSKRIIQSSIYKRRDSWLHCNAPDCSVSHYIVPREKPGPSCDAEFRQNSLTT